ncbi:flagellar biosynthesis protein FlhF [Aureibacillus halotolerans]|uniref:Flagellar biosynthesis protein FlhF n=1 Tax=Aureibacillus halotolerans TaxID=1508390 RepID=A0A4R6U5B6_9BACI|nr:flagellar biosynthesis protein FlhF [Aureibacillus halotolerans]TDQ39665.1 flagellar biosynthesis protein FlhF [Aureibacillus halotolerans]
MKTKKIVAGSMPEAMTKVRHELGQNAVILHSKKVQTGGWLGFFKKPQIEVLATIDPYPHVSEKRTKPIKEKPTLRPTKGMELRPSTAKKHATEITWSNQARNQLPDWLQSVEKRLVQNGFASDQIDGVCQFLLKNWYNREKPDSSELMDWERIYFEGQLGKIPHGPAKLQHKIVVLVGPTGVGKTTTLAKLAADATVNQKQSVGFITFDTYRIGAIEQLKTYGEILDAPVMVAYSPEDVTQALEKLKDKDKVFIDTAGRNYREEGFVEELSRMLPDEKECVTYLVLSLTSKHDDMEQIYQNFRKIPINRFIFTKKDETSSYGAMFNMVDKHQLGVAYVTMGQDVPEDIVSSSTKSITNLLAQSRKLYG